MSPGAKSNPLRDIRLAGGSCFRKARVPSLRPVISSFEDFKQRGFAAAVGTDQTGTIALREAERKIFKQNARAETLAERGDTEENTHALSGWHEGDWQARINFE